MSVILYVQISAFDTEKKLTKCFNIQIKFIKKKAKKSFSKHTVSSLWSSRYAENSTSRNRRVAIERPSHGGVAVACKHLSIADDTAVAGLPVE